MLEGRLSWSGARDLGPVKLELLAGADAHDLLARHDWAPGTAALLRQVRAATPVYRDDRPMADHLLVGRNLVRGGLAAVP